MILGQREVSRNQKPFIVAEMSGNHNQSLEKALELVQAAYRAGVDALKLQTYTPETMTLDLAADEFFISDDASLWKGRSLYDLYQEAHTPWEWHEPIFKRARDMGLVCFSTPFDETAVDFLEDLDAPCYKIASFENVDLPLIKKAARTGKPLIISTGMAGAAELSEAVQTAREAGCTELALLKCTSTYPADPSESNLRTIPHLRELFQCQTGLSDHTLGIGAAVASVALGATIIEKHFTLSRQEGGLDAAFSLEPAEMKALVEERERAWQALGQVKYGPVQAEHASAALRRSLYITADLKAGDVLSRENVRSVRPGHGLHPRYLDLVVGTRIKKEVRRGTALTWELIL